MEKLSYQDKLSLIYAANVSAAYDEEMEKQAAFLLRGASKLFGGAGKALRNSGANSVARQRAIQNKVMGHTRIPLTDYRNAAGAFAESPLGATQLGLGQRLRSIFPGFGKDMADQGAARISQVRGQHMVGANGKVRLNPAVRQFYDYNLASANRYGTGGTRLTAGNSLNEAGRGLGRAADTLQGWQDSALNRIRGFASNTQDQAYTGLGRALGYIS